MKQLVQYPLMAGGSVLVEVEVEDGGEAELLPVASPGETIARAQDTFEESLSGIEPIAETVIGRIRELADAPDEAEVEFGLKLTGQTSFVLASASVDANLRITLTWRKHSDGTEASALANPFLPSSD